MGRHVDYRLAIAIVLAGISWLSLAVRRRTTQIAEQMQLQAERQAIAEREAREQVRSQRFHGSVRLVVGAGVALALIGWMSKERQATQRSEARLSEQISKLGEQETILESQIGALRRQEDNLEDQVLRLAERETELESQVQGLSRREAGLREQEGELETQVQRLSERMDGLRKQEDELETQVLRLAEQEDMLEQQARLIRQREAETAQRLGVLENDGEVLGSQVGQSLAASEELQREIKTLRERERNLEQSEQALQGEVQQLQAALLQNEAHLDEANSKIGFLTTRLDELDSQRRQRPVAPDWTKTLPPDTFTSLAARARSSFSRLCIPDSAIRRPEELDSARERTQWLKHTWQALGALQEYALASQQFNGGFFEWNQHSGCEHILPLEKIAMKESEATSAMHSSSRVFEVDRQISADGRLSMEAHLKPVKGGGQQIPRVYFHDDTSGQTGLVHIGFIGPHHLVPIAGSS